MFLGELREEYRNLPDMNLQEHISLWLLVILTFLVSFNLQWSTLLN
jgi:hypothetical protein